MLELFYDIKLVGGPADGYHFRLHHLPVYWIWEATHDPFTDHAPTWYKLHTKKSEYEFEYRPCPTWEGERSILLGYVRHLDKQRVQLYMEQGLAAWDAVANPNYGKDPAG